MNLPKYANTVLIRDIYYTLYNIYKTYNEIDYNNFLLTNNSRVLNRRV